MARDLRAGMLRAEQAAAEAMTLEELAERALLPLAEALDVPVVACYELDAEGRSRAHFAPGLADTMRFYAAHFTMDDPLQAVKKRLNPRLAVTTDLVDRRTFLRSGVYNDLYTRIDVEHQLVARLSKVGFTVPGCIAIVMGRSARQRPYDRREVAAVRRVLPAFEAAARRSARVAMFEQRTTALAAILESRGSSSYVLLDRGGALVWSSPRATRLFPRGLPDEIVAAARSVAAAATARELPSSAPPVLVSVGGPVPVRAEPFLVRDPDRAGEPLVAVRLDDDTGAGAAATELGRRARLTAGETTVLGHLARGGSNRDIAAGLHVSTETVRTHIHRILRKLGVRSRLEAVVLLRDLDRSA